jgi:hypothetical protein
MKSGKKQNRNSRGFVVPRAARRRETRFSSKDVPYKKQGRSHIGFAP